MRWAGHLTLSDQPRAYQYFEIMSMLWLINGKNLQK